MGTFLFLLLGITLVLGDDGPVVTTNLGIVKGFAVQTTEGTMANIFLGVPFAKPPVGDLRFEKPVKLDPWAETKDAVEFAPACTPHDRSALSEPHSENCLYLNIMTPAYNVESTNKSAVMLWIHGGAYCVGTARLYGYTGIVNNFVSRDIIVVTIQYRLGPYGFVSDGSKELPGNLGLWDQLAALKFVRENIASFGGDPERITLFGSSAGGGSVNAHTLSPQSRDLFAGSIEMSGSTLAPWASGEEIIEVSKKLASELSCSTEDSKALKQCLRQKSENEIFDAVEKTGKARYGFNIAKYTPRIDGDFFPKEFEDLVKEAPKKPTIIGLVEKEAAFFTTEGNIKPINELSINSADFESFGENDVLDFIENVAAPERIFGSSAYEVRQRLVLFYLGRDVPEKPDYKFYLERYTQLVSDVLFNIPCLRMKDLKVENGWPVWFYFNVHHNPKAYKRDTPIKGATHLDEYPYLFDITPYKHFDLDDNDRIMQKAMLETFTHFAKQGTPSTEEYVWERVTRNDSMKHFRFSADPGMRDSFLKESSEFWKVMEEHGYDVIRRRFANYFEVKDEL